METERLERDGKFMIRSSSLKILCKYFYGNIIVNHYGYPIDEIIELHFSRVKHLKKCYVGPIYMYQCRASQSGITGFEPLVTTQAHNSSQYFPSPLSS